MTPLDAALTYAGLGWRAFPVMAAGKRPAFGDSWPDLATTDDAQLRTWWRPGSRLNLGLVAGEAFDVFDLEAEHLPRFRTFLAGRLPPLTPVARTGRGGLHIYVRPTGIRANRRLYLDGIHVGELKSTRGYVLAAPSVTTGRYAWLWPPETPLGEAPDWLLGIVGKPVPAERSVPWRQASLAPASDLAPLVRHVRASQPGIATRSSTGRPTGPPMTACRTRWPRYPCSTPSSPRPSAGSRWSSVSARAGRSIASAYQR